MLEGNLVEVLMFRFSIPLCITKEAKLSTKSKSRELLLLHLKRNERIGNVMFRENIAMNVKFWKEVKSLKVLSSKSRVRTESHIDFHLDIQSSFFIQIQTRLFNESIRFSSNSSINVQNHFQVEVEALVIQGPKLANAMSQVKKLEVSILVLGQKKPSSFFSCSSCSNTEEFLEYCINNGECLTIGVRKRSKGNNGYLISTRGRWRACFRWCRTCSLQGQTYLRSGDKEKILAGIKKVSTSKNFMLMFTSLRIAVQSLGLIFGQSGSGKTTLLQFLAGIRNQHLDPFTYIFLGMMGILVNLQSRWCRKGLVLSSSFQRA
ncbi:unnamed protein product [Trifolium pratense]|uniref:Uncharacterized protein n=1 Tax=Trifolium pratense TaxID=57577 RepID=A0ACB0L674_TRIPR|nr:unnamed protein product [Trifolium pratense]